MATTRMTTEEVLALPASVRFTEAYTALGISRALAYRMVREGKFPIPLLPVGNTYRANRSDLLRELGITQAAVA